MDRFKEKSLKLLVDPCKFKGSKLIIKNDKFKMMLETKFNLVLTDINYKYIVDIIKTETSIISILNSIIDQVMINHTP
jgi:hypothetical protein